MTIISELLVKIIIIKTLANKHLLHFIVKAKVSSAMERDDFTPLNEREKHSPQRLFTDMFHIPTLT